MLTRVQHAPVQFYIKMLKSPKYHEAQNDLRIPLYVREKIRKRYCGRELKQKSEATEHEAEKRLISGHTHVRSACSPWSRAEDGFEKHGFRMNRSFHSQDIYFCITVCESPRR